MAHNWCPGREDWVNFEMTPASVPVARGNMFPVMGEPPNRSLPGNRVPMMTQDHMNLNSSMDQDRGYWRGEDRLSPDRNPHFDRMPHERRFERGPMLEKQPVGQLNVSVIDYQHKTREDSLDIVERVDKRYSPHDVRDISDSGHCKKMRYNEDIGQAAYGIEKSMPNRFLSVTPPNAGSGVVIRSILKKSKNTSEDWGREEKSREDGRHDDTRIKHAAQVFGPSCQGNTPENAQRDRLAPTSTQDEDCRLRSFQYSERQSPLRSVEGRSSFGRSPDLQSRYCREDNWTPMSDNQRDSYLYTPDRGNLDERELFVGSYRDERSSPGGWNSRQSPSRTSPNRRDDRWSPSRRSHDRRDDRQSPSRRSHDRRDDRQSPSRRSLGRRDDRQSPSRRSLDRRDDRQSPSRRSPDRRDDRQTPTQRSLDRRDDRRSPSRRSLDRRDDRRSPSRRSLDRRDYRQSPSRRSLGRRDDRQSPPRRSLDRRDDRQSQNQRSQDRRDDIESPSLSLPDRRDDIQSPSWRSHDRHSPSWRSHDNRNDRQSPSRRSHDRRDDRQTPTRRSLDRRDDRQSPNQRSQDRRDDIESPSRRLPDRRDDIQSPSWRSHDRHSPSWRSRDKRNDRQSPSRRSHNRRDGRLSPSRRLCDRRGDRQSPSRRSHDRRDARQSPSRRSQDRRDDIQSPNWISHGRQSPSHRSCDRREVRLSPSLRSPDRRDNRQSPSRGSHDRRDDNLSPSLRSCDRYEGRQSPSCRSHDRRDDRFSPSRRSYDRRDDRQSPIRGYRDDWPDRRDLGHSPYEDFLSERPRKSPNRSFRDDFSPDRFSLDDRRTHDSCQGDRHSPIRVSRDERRSPSRKFREPSRSSRMFRKYSSPHSSPPRHTSGDRDQSDRGRALFDDLWICTGCGLENHDARVLCYRCFKTRDKTTEAGPFKGTFYPPWTTQPVNTHENDRKRIRVSNLPLSVSAEEMFEVFSECGKVLYANIVVDPATKRSKGYGFVSFNTESEAAYAATRTHRLIGSFIYCSRVKFMEHCINIVGFYHGGQHLRPAVQAFLKELADTLSDNWNTAKSDVTPNSLTLFEKLSANYDDISSDEEDSGPMFKCRVECCGFKGTQQKFHHHWKEIHSSFGKLFICPVCDTGCADRCAMRSHLMQGHGVTNEGGTLDNVLRNVKMELRRNPFYVNPGCSEKEAMVELGNSKIRSAQKSHKTVKVYKCPEKGCLFAALAYSFIRHWNSKHLESSSVLTCPVCSVHFVEKTKLIEHFRIEHKIHPYDDVIGSKVTGAEKKSFDEDEEEFKMLSGRFICRVAACDFHGPKSAFRRHWEERHILNQTYFRCPYCSIGCRNQPQIRYHMVKVHKVQITDPILDDALTRTFAKERRNPNFLDPGNVEREAKMEICVRKPPSSSDQKKTSRSKSAIEILREKTSTKKTASKTTKEAVSIVSSPPDYLLMKYNGQKADSIKTFLAWTDSLMENIEMAHQRAREKLQEYDEKNSKHKKCEENSKLQKLQENSKLHDLKENNSKFEESNDNSQLKELENSNLQELEKKGDLQEVAENIKLKKYEEGNSELQELEENIEMQELENIKLQELAENSEFQELDEDSSELQDLEENSELQNMEDNSDLQELEENSELQEVEEEDSELQEVEEDSELQEVEEEDSELQEVEEENSELQEVEEEDSELQEVDVENSELQELDEENSELQELDENSEMQELEENSEMQEVEEEDSELQEVDVENSELQVIDVENSELQELDEENSELQELDENSEMQELEENSEL